MQWLALIARQHGRVEAPIPLSGTIARLPMQSASIDAVVSGPVTLLGIKGAWRRGARIETASADVESGDILAFATESLSVHYGDDGKVSAWLATHDPHTATANEPMLAAFIRSEARRAPLSMLALEPEAREGPVADLAVLAHAVSGVATARELVGVLAGHVVLVTPDARQQFDQLRRRLLAEHSASAVGALARRGVYLSLERGLEGLDEVFATLKSSGGGKWQYLDW